MNVLVHVAVPAVVPGARAHAVNVPVTPLTLSDTDPVGVLTAPAAVSTTVAVQVEPWLITTGLMHVTLVVVVRFVTVRLNVPMLAW